MGKCKECGEDISDIIPITGMKEQTLTYELKAIGDDFSVTLDQPVIVIGRGAELKDYLGSKMYVSRIHAKLTVVAGQVMLENLAGADCTFVNNLPVAETEPTVLADGDEIGLGGVEINGERHKQAAYFTFHIKA